ncbi:SusC/RagA family TonB-linked outer membrane protein [Larkinella terrae]|uniref:SusC/RagA family TonB-linked outer membrane protein n=1 Tax=Larkinella terrae TaxID=2025311 RepID=A0A7K0ENJ1_9BACT|nr:SusC/RagA family TonB-linked outer membrane protein [Larkinella terrae]MRS63018.1 SusC/RagA family TonB-linked outer membrane protein [Larkinella terrae]
MLKIITIKRSGSLFLLCNLLFSLSIYAQVQVSGKVTDATGATLPGVSVIVKETTIGTVTNSDGIFSIPNVPNVNSTLVFSFIGYTTQETVVGNRKSINISLAAADNQLSEVVVIGYGTAKRSTLTGAVSQVDSKVISVQANSTVTRALEGVVPGIQVSSIDGQPGLDMGIRLRGAGSTSQNSSNALIVIDGVPTEYPNALSSINPKDIESINVLKDAASTAVYGSRGANGVLLVTTKRGTKGKPNISVQTRAGFNYLGGLRYDIIDDAKDIYEHAWLSIYNSARYGVNGGSSTDGKFTTNVANPNMSHEAAAMFASAHLFDYTGSKTNFAMNLLGNYMAYDVPGAVYTTTGSGANASATMSGAYLIDPATGKLNPNARPLWEAGSYKDYFFEKMFRQEHTVSASGGSDKMDYFVSVGMLEDPSYIRGSTFKRYNARTNVNAQLTSWLKVGTNLGYSMRNTLSPATRFGRNPGTVQQNVFRWVNGQNQLVPLFARDLQGNIRKNPNGTDMVSDNANDTYSPLGVQPGTFPNGTTSQPLYTTNLIDLLDKDIDLRESHDLNLKGYFTVSFLKNFTFTNNISYDRFTEVRTRYGTPETGAVVGIGAIGKYYTNTGVFNTQQLLNWGKEFGRHSVTGLAAHEFYQYKSDLLNYASAYSLINGFTGAGNFTSRYNTAGAPFGTPGYGGDITAMDSYFGRAVYNYDDKYFMEGSLRRDGSSKFRFKENRWGTFWSVGGGWRISQEKFMQRFSDVVNELKVRASYGVIGNQSGISNYSGYQTWSYGAVYTNSTAGTGVPATYTLQQGAAVNDKLTWENTHTFDAGIDFTLLNRRLSGTIDVYNKNTVNSVFAQPLAASMGQASLTLNSAQIVNRGVEIALDIKLIQNKNINWSIGLNGTHYRTILTKFPKSVGSPALGGNFTGFIDGWGIANGGANTAGQIMYLRGENKDYYNLYLYKYAGVDQNTGLPLFHHTVTPEDQAAGRFKDSNVGSIVSTPDYTLATRYEMGSAIPKIIGGFSTSFQYKGFDFTAILAYQLGGKFLSVEYANNLYRSGNIGNALSKEVLGNTWTPENKGAKFPMAFYGDTFYTSGATFGPWQYTDQALFSASYLNVKNLTLGYTLSGPFLDRLKTKSVRVYASGDNLTMLTSHSGIDPRMSLVGGMEVGAAVYLPMSTFSVGLNLNF